MTNATDDVLEIERGFWTHADEPDYFRDHVAEGGMSVIEPMGVLEKAQAIEMAADKPWEHVEFSDVKIREIDPDCIVLAYHGQGSHPGDAAPYRGSIASTYRRINGKWQLVMSAHQPWAKKDDAKK